jgi:hypothetical protein
MGLHHLGEYLQLTALIWCIVSTNFTILVRSVSGYYR